MTHADDFDDLYKQVRDRLLVEAYALTGDQHVSRTAVRDAFAVAWHHWHKVHRLEDREAWLRPLVWKRARHRHTARPWHKEKDLPPEVAATLEALNTLTPPQRKALVLTHLSPLPMTEIAREIGVPVQVAEEHLQAATAAFALARETPSTAIRQHVEQLREVVAGGRWPRSTIVRRAGTARRRTHTVVGVVGTVAAVVLSGMVVAQGETVDATLDEQGFERRATRIETVPPPPELDEKVLLEASQVRRVGRDLKWSETGTHSNTEGDGIVLPCQEEPFADPNGLDALVRSFEGSTTPGKRDKGGKGGGGNRGGNDGSRGGSGPRVEASVTQMVELSTSPEAAEKAFETAQGWYAGCRTPRTQLLAVHRVRGVGDDARLFTMRSWRGPTSTVRVGLVRSGQLVTTTVDEAPGLRPATDAPAAMLAAAVNAACGSAGAGNCASPPRVRRMTVPPAGTAPGMLSEFDLPPVDGARGPWVGTTPKRARLNEASTRCDNTDFTGKGLRRNLTRTYLFPRGRRPDEFGMTQTVALAGNPKMARNFVGQVRDRIARCADDGFGTDVTRLVHETSQKVDLTVWRLELDISDQNSVEFLMAIMRHRNSVAQVGFTPAKGRSMARDDFVWVSRRALERLPRLRVDG